MHHHNHDHSHEGHHHHKVSAADSASTAFIVGIVLNSAYVIVEAAMGFANHSMALLSDAGHNLGDVASLILSLLAFRLAKMKPSDSFTYGYKKSTILAALTNAVILLVSVGLLSYESVRQLMRPHPVEGGTMAIVAGIGIVVNFGSAFLFFKHKDKEMNTRGAYLHLMADALVSLGVVVAGIIMQYTHWYWLDGATSLGILLVILISTWSLLMGSLRLTLDAVPADIKKQEIEQAIVQMSGVQSIHHMHIWAMSTTENALTAHLIPDETLSFDEKIQLVHRIKHELQHFNIQHATIEMESSKTHCEEEACSHK
ncbi:cation transporter [Flavipsychrobacter stenotrophus]|uniref:Cation transporter n=1 Tax=Flavipsychrobacter stenotrophus TaxID=2077091 RepID=A0A2S7SYM0_9BACT|nr:cation diffusion facilitator family transporter [Flavipsychrobacter stenotrophus]PQJ11626.1 cation transporter [Flavipsychrobacter stenotrophus]